MTYQLSEAPLMLHSATYGPLMNEIIILQANAF